MSNHHGEIEHAARRQEKCIWELEYNSEKKSQQMSPLKAAMSEEAYGEGQFRNSSRRQRGSQAATECPSQTWERALNVRARLRSLPSSR